MNLSKKSYCSPAMRYQLERDSRRKLNLSICTFLRRYLLKRIRSAPINQITKSEAVGGMMHGFTM